MGKPWEAEDQRGRPWHKITQSINNTTSYNHQTVAIPEPIAAILAAGHNLHLNLFHVSCQFRKAKTDDLIIDAAPAQAENIERDDELETP